MALWTPENLATPPFGWFDAADASSLTTSGSTVTSWASRIGTVVLANTTDAKPALVPGALNDMPGVDFSVGRLFNRSINIPANTPISVFTIGSILSAKVGDYYRGVCFVTGQSNDAFGGKTPIIALPNTSGIPAGQRTFGYDVFNQSSINVTMDTFHVLEGYASSATFRVAAADGTVGPVVGSGSPAYSSALTSMVVSGSGNGDGLYWPGMFCEIVVVLGVPTADEVARIEGYLAWRWALQGKLPSGHVYKSSAPAAGAEGAAANAGTMLASIGTGGSGSLRATAAASPALGDAIVVGLASVAVAANMAATLDAVVASAVSSPALPSIFAQVGATLAPVIVDGAARSPIAATAQPRLCDLAGAGVALLPISATSGRSIAPITAGGAGELSLVASSSPALWPVAAISTAAVATIGLVDGKLSSISVAATAGAQPVVAASSSVDLAVIMAVGSSSVQLRGTVDAMVSAVMAAGDARAPTAGASGVLIGQVAGRSVARTGVSGLSAVQIGPLASAAQAHTILTAGIATMLRPVTSVGAAVTGAAPVGPIVIAARNRFVIPARQRRFSVPRRQRSFLIRKGTCMSSITKYAAEERQYQADWSADLNGQTIVDTISATSSDSMLIVDRVTHDGPIMKFWVKGGTSGQVATIRFVAPTSGGEDLAWQQTVVVY